MPPKKPNKVPGETKLNTKKKKTEKTVILIFF